MGTTYTIYCFEAPNEEETKAIDHFSDYESFPALERSFISLYRENDKSVQNLVDSQFAKKMILPESIVDYDTLYLNLGFCKELVQEKKIHISCGNLHWIEFTDGESTKRIETSELDHYQIKVPVRCIALKMEVLWDSNEACFCPDNERIAKYLPDVDRYQFVPINNNLLAKAEIPFLIFERNKEKCFIEKY